MNGNFSHFTQQLVSWYVCNINARYFTKHLNNVGISCNDHLEQSNGIIEYLLCQSLHRVIEMQSFHRTTGYT